MECGIWKDDVNSSVIGNCGLWKSWNRGTKIRESKEKKESCSSSQMWSTWNIFLSICVLFHMTFMNHRKTGEGVDQS